MSKKPKTGAMGSPTESSLPAREDFQSLVARANDGDAQALADLRLTLDEHPQIWQSVGDLATHARMSMIRLVANGNQLLAESLIRKAAEMERELAGPAPSPLERLAVQRIVACWLELQYTDTVHPMPSGQTLKQAKFSLELKGAAQRRFQAAVKSLALIRTMLPGSAPMGTPTAPALEPALDLTRNGVGGHNGNGNGYPKPGSSGNGKAASLDDATEAVIPINRIKRFATKKIDLVPADN